MTIYIDMAIAVAFSLRLGRGGFHHGDLMRVPDPGVKYGRRYTSTNAFQEVQTLSNMILPSMTALRKMPITPMPSREQLSAKGASQVERTARSCATTMRRKGNAIVRIVQVPTPVPEMVSGNTEMWRQVSQQNDAGLIRLAKFGQVKVGGGVGPLEIPVSRYVCNEWGYNPRG